MRDRRAHRRLSPCGLCYGLLLAVCLSASGCAADGSAMRAGAEEPAVTQTAGADTSATEERRDDPGEWRELDTEKDEERAVATVWLITGLAGIALSILGALALF